jgi:ring-1,2-phenylacetyl-CoA epoxidase subunit PaaE
VAKEVTIELYGDSFTFAVEDDESILDAALRNDIDAPYACMSGTCNSCQAKVVEGEVRMEDADALTEDEIESGEVLTCCTFLVSDKVKVVYPD